MRILSVLLIPLSFSAAGQPNQGTCYYSHKTGLITNCTLLLFPMSDGRYQLELYTYGAGVFWGLPYADTLLTTGGSLASARTAVSVTGNKLKVSSGGHNSRFRFRELPVCDTNVNLARNWSYREVIRYRIKDEAARSKFEAETEPRLRLACHEDFVQEADRMLAAILR